MVYHGSNGKAHYRGTDVFFLIIPVFIGKQVARSSAFHIENVKGEQVLEV